MSKTVHPLLIVPITLSIVINGAGFLFGWYHSIFFYDELAHFITPLCLTILISYVILKVQYNRYWLPVPSFSLHVLSSIVLLAVGWEIYEFILFSFFGDVIKMNLADTITDLIYGISGSIVGLILVHKVDFYTFIQEEKKVRQVPFIASFDSATIMLRSLVNVLYDRDFKGMNAIPSFIQPVLPYIDLIPKKLKSWLFKYFGRLDAIKPDVLPFIQTQRIAQVITGNYPKKKVETIMIGSPNGALTHLCALISIPYLPQTLPLLIKKKELHPDKPLDDLNWGKDHAQVLLQNNPDVAIYQMIDPVHDRLMSQVMCYFRMKYIRLPESYKQIITEQLKPGGTILISNCKKKWRALSVQARHTYQLGGAGDLKDTEYYNSSPRLKRFLKKMNSHFDGFAFPKPDTIVPEAEWGYDTRLTNDIQSFAQSNGYKIAEISYDEPQDVSPYIADLYRWWYRENDIPAEKLFIESFMYIEPYWTLKANLIPYWMMFNTKESYEPLNQYLSEIKSKDPFTYAYLTLFSNGVKTPGFIPVNQWKSVFSHMKQDGKLAGVNEDRYPEDFSSNFRYYAVMKSLFNESMKTVPPLPLSLFRKHIAETAGQYQMSWNEHA